jgi:hypothetical protein
MYKIIPLKCNVALKQLTPTAAINTLDRWWHHPIGLCCHHGVDYIVLFLDANNIGISKDY